MCNENEGKFNDLGLCELLSEVMDRVAFATNSGYLVKVSTTSRMRNLMVEIETELQRNRETPIGQ